MIAPEKLPILNLAKDHLLKHRAKLAPAHATTVYNSATKVLEYLEGHAT